MKQFLLKILFFAIVNANGNAQSKWLVTIVGDDPLNLFEIKNKKSYDSISIIIHLNNVKNQYLAKGFINAQVDSIVYIDSLCKVFWYTGEKYKINKLNFNEETGSIIKGAGIMNLNFKTKPLASIVI